MHRHCRHGGHSGVDSPPRFGRAIIGNVVPRLGRRQDFPWWNTTHITQSDDVRALVGAEKNAMEWPLGRRTTHTCLIPGPTICSPATGPPQKRLPRKADTVRDLDACFLRNGIEKATARHMCFLLADNIAHLAVLHPHVFWTVHSSRFGRLRYGRSSCVTTASRVCTAAHVRSCLRPPSGRRVGGRRG